MSTMTESYLHLADHEAKAAGLLLENHPRHAAFWIQQAAEKLLKAVLTVEDIRFELYDIRIGSLAATLPEGHCWREPLMSFDPLQRIRRQPVSTSTKPARYASRRLRKPCGRP